MSKPHRSPIFYVVTAIVILVMLALIIAAIWSGGSRHGAAVSQNNRNIIHNAKEAEQHIEKTCLNREPAEMAECIRHILEATNQHNRAENNLVAQTEMSLWAFLLLIVSTFALAFTAIGVWFIYRTLSVTRDTLAEAKKATEAANKTVDVSQKVGTEQVRAFLFIKEVLAGIEVRKYMGDEPDRYFLNINLMMDNGGQSPATKVRRRITLRKDPPEKDGLVDWVALEGKMNRDIPVSSPFSFYQTEMEIRKCDFFGFCRQEYIFVMSGAATYDILFGGKTGETPFEFHLIFNKFSASHIQVKNKTQIEYS